MVFIARAADPMLPGWLGRQSTMRMALTNDSLKYAPFMHPMLNIAVRAARKAGSIINRAALSSGGLQVRAKRANDFVTEVDRAAEAAIIEIVQKAYPDHAILGEESGAA